MAIPTRAATSSSKATSEKAPARPKRVQRAGLSRAPTKTNVEDGVLGGDSSWAASDNEQERSFGFSVPGKKPVSAASKVRSARDAKKPASSNKAVKIDIKGKGRAVDLPEDAEPTRQSDAAGRTRASRATQRPPERYLELLMSDTPARGSGRNVTSTPRHPVPLAPAPSLTSAYRDSRARAASVSLAPAGSTSLMASTMKPVKLKSLIRSSPPRYVISSDEDEGAASASSSDDGFLLKSRDSSGSTSRRSATVDGEDKKPRRRKAPVGEYEWDERSRSCVPRRTKARERERSRSAALALKAEHRDEDEILTDAVDADATNAYASTSNILGGLHEPEHDNTRDEAPQDDLLLYPYQQKEADIAVPYLADEGDQPNADLLPMEEAYEQQDESMFDFVNIGGPDSDDDDQPAPQLSTATVPGELPPSEPADPVLKGRQSSPFTDDFEKSIRRVVTMEEDGNIPAGTVEADPVDKLDQDTNGQSAATEIGVEVDHLRGSLSPVPITAVHNDDAQPENTRAIDGGVDARDRPLAQADREESPLPPSSPPPLPTHKEAISTETDSEDDAPATVPASVISTGRTWRPDLVARLASPGMKASQASKSKEIVRIAVIARDDDDADMSVDSIVPVRGISRSSSAPPEPQQEDKNAGPPQAQKESPLTPLEELHQTAEAGPESPSKASDPSSTPPVRPVLLSEVSGMDLEVQDPPDANFGSPKRPRLESEVLEDVDQSAAEPLDPPAVVSALDMRNGDRNEDEEEPEAPSYVARRSSSPVRPQLLSESAEPPRSPLPALMLPDQSISQTPAKTTRLRSPSPLRPVDPSQLLSPAAKHAHMLTLAGSPQMKSRSLSPAAAVGKKRTPEAAIAPETAWPSRPPSVTEAASRSPARQAHQAARSAAHSTVFRSPSPAAAVQAARSPPASALSSTFPATPSKTPITVPKATPNIASLRERIQSMSSAHRAAGAAARQLPADAQLLRSPGLLSPLRAQTQLPMQSTPGRMQSTAPPSPGGAFLPRSLHQMLESGNTAHVPPAASLARSPARLEPQSQLQTAGRDTLRSPTAPAAGNAPTTLLLEGIRTLRRASILSSPGKPTQSLPQQLPIKEEEEENSMPLQVPAGLQPAIDFTDATPEEHEVAIRSPIRAPTPLRQPSVEPHPAGNAVIAAEEVANAQHDEKSSTDSEEEAEEVARSLSRSRSLSKSPGASLAKSPPVSPAKQSLMDLDEDVPLSPNVTLRRQRSTSRSTASNRSKPATPAQLPRSAVKRSFAELNFDSSPMSVAASISHKSFEALDTSSEDDEEEDGQEAMRPSPSKQIAAAQLAAAQQKQHRYNSLATSSSDEDEARQQTKKTPIKSILNSSPVNVGKGSNLFASAISSVSQSTPAKLLGTLVLSAAKRKQGSPESADSHRPDRSASASSPKLASPVLPAETSHEKEAVVDAIADDRSLSEGQDDTASALAEVSMIVQPGSPHPVAASIDVADAVEEPAVADMSMAVSQTVDAGDGSTFIDGLSSERSADTSAVLDEFRPRSDLIAPTLLNRSRPAPARARLARSKIPVARSTKPVAPVQIATQAPTSSPPAPQISRALSKQPSVASSSTGSGIVQVSSVDALAAARAAAILKVHHLYVHDGPAPPPLSRSASQAKDGETVLDELLKEAEMEVSMRNGIVTKVEETSPSRVLENVRRRHLSDHSLGNASQSHANRSARRVTREPPASRLGVWTRKDWRALEQCFIDERRRTGQHGTRLRGEDVIQLYLESEGIAVEQCVGEWHMDKLEARVEALIQRKKTKLADQSQRHRSMSVLSTVPSRAPSDFFREEDSRMLVEVSAGDFTALSPGEPSSSRRVAWSAEPSFPLSSTPYNNYSRFLQPRPASNAAATGLSRNSSLTDLYIPPLKTGVSFVTDQGSSLYPSLVGLEQSMRPTKQLPIRGKKIAAAVGRFEQLGSDRLPIALGPMKRKALSEEPASSAAGSKRQRL